MQNLKHVVEEGGPTHIPQWFSVASDQFIGRVVHPHLLPGTTNSLRRLYNMVIILLATRNVLPTSLLMHARYPGFVCSLVLCGACDCSLNEKVVFFGHNIVVVCVVTNIYI